MYPEKNNRQCLLSKENVSITITNHLFCYSATGLNCQRPLLNCLIHKLIYFILTGRTGFSLGFMLSMTDSMLASFRQSGFFLAAFNNLLRLACHKPTSFPERPLGRWSDNSDITDSETPPLVCAVSVSFFIIVAFNIFRSCTRSILRWHLDALCSGVRIFLPLLPIVIMYPSACKFPNWLCMWHNTLLWIC